jgi:hypothetical protein
MLDVKLRKHPPDGSTVAKPWLGGSILKLVPIEHTFEAQVKRERARWGFESWGTSWLLNSVPNYVANYAHYYAYKALYCLPMAFEEFTKKTARAAGTAYVTIQKRGVISLNHAAYTALGEPEAVTLLYDRERQLVGFRPADPKSEHAYLVRVNTRGTSHLVTGTLFTNHYGISTETARRWQARMIEDDIMAIDLTETPQEAIPPPPVRIR